MTWKHLEGDTETKEEKVSLSSYLFYEPDIGLFTESASFHVVLLACSDSVNSLG